MASFWYERTVRRIKEVLCPRLNFDLSKKQNYFIIWNFIIWNLPEWVGKSGELHVDRNYLKEKWLWSCSYESAGSIWTAMRLVCKRYLSDYNKTPVTTEDGWKVQPFDFLPLPDHASTMEVVKIRSKQRSVWIKTNRLLGLLSAALHLKTLEC